MLGQAKKIRKLKAALKISDDQINDLGDRLVEQQTRIELMQVEIVTKDEEYLKFISELHEHMGESVTGRDHTLQYVAGLRAQAETMQTIQIMLAGQYDADAALLRRLACAMGTSHMDLNSVVQRAGVLSQVNVRNAELERLVRQKEDKIDELEDELEVDDGGGW